MSDTNPEVGQSMTDEKVIEVARTMYASDEVQIDPHPSIARAESGAWCAAWVWVPSEEVETSTAFVYALTDCTTEANGDKTWLISSSQDGKNGPYLVRYTAHSRNSYVQDTGKDTGMRYGSAPISAESANKVPEEITSLTVLATYSYTGNSVIGILCTDEDICRARKDITRTVVDVGANGDTTQLDKFIESFNYKHK